MRLEEWFKHLESFEQTGRLDASTQAEPLVNEAAPAAAPDQPLAFGLSDGQTSRAAPEIKPPGSSAAFSPSRTGNRSFRSPINRADGPLTLPELGVGEPKPGVRRAALLVQPESREQLLARLLDPILTLEEAAKVLDVCPTTVRRYTNKGLLQHYRTNGNQRRFRLSHVLSFLGESGGLLDGELLTAPLPALGAGASDTLRGRKALSRFSTK